MDIRERKILSPDLDIFGDDNESVQGTEGGDTDGESMDIFGGLGDQPTESTEDTAEGSTSDTDATASEGEAETETETNSEAEKTDEEISLDKLFDEIEAESKTTGNSDLQVLIDELRDQLNNTVADNKIKDKQLEVLNERLMGKTGDETGMSMYKTLIDKLESNPKIMMLAKFRGDDNEKIKGKLINILSDSIYELTGEDVSELINKTQSDKILAATGGNASSETPSFKESKADEEEMNYEDSIKNLF